MISDSYKDFLKQMLQLPVWEIKEACYLIHGCKKFIGECLIRDEKTQKLLMDRTSLYIGPYKYRKVKLPEEEEGLCSKVKECLEFLIGDIRRGFISGSQFDLTDFHHSMFPQSSYLILPKDFLCWAVINGFVLPIELQELTGLCQIQKNNKDISEPLTRKLMVQAAATFLWLQDSSITIEKIMKNPLMNDKGPGSFYKDEKTLREIISEVDPRPSIMRIGRPTKRNVKVVFKLHPDLFHKSRIHYPKLQIFLSEIMRILFRIKPEIEFSECIVNPIIQLYLNASIADTAKHAINMILQKAFRKPPVFFNGSLENTGIFC